MGTTSVSYTHLTLPTIVPHCTVAMTKDEPEKAFFDASDFVLHKFKKIQGMFKSIGLVKVTFPVEELYTVELA